MPRPAGSSQIIKQRDQILERIAAGERISAIAQSLGYKDHSAISQRLGNDPDYKAAIRASVESVLEKRERELERADDNVTVARGRELLSHARWRAKVIAPEVYGDRQVIDLMANRGDDTLSTDASSLLASLRVAAKQPVIDVTSERVDVTD